MDEQILSLDTMQMKTLVLLHKGNTNSEIATKLKRTTKTIEAYTSAIYDVLNVKNRVQAALYYERKLNEASDKNTSRNIAKLATPKSAILS